VHSNNDIGIPKIIVTIRDTTLVVNIDGSLTSLIVTFSLNRNPKKNSAHIEIKNNTEIITLKLNLTLNSSLFVNFPDSNFL